MTQVNVPSSRKRERVIEERRLELVDALANLVKPMDEILADHKRSQELQIRLLKMMKIECALMLLLLVGLSLVLLQQWSQGNMQRSILLETLAQKRVLTDQGLKTDDVNRKLDEQPKITVRPPASTDPTGDPVVVIETPASSAKEKSPARYTDSASAKPARSASRVEIPIKLPVTDDKGKGRKKMTGD